jgi:CheY-like chemotaxis protein/anti-sigma regulatory factor (Ser/Thr protein kinase)
MRASKANNRFESIASAETDTVETLKDVLNASLEYSALCAGTLGLDCYEFSIRDALASAAAEHEAEAKAKEIELRTHIEESACAAALGDARRLRQMVSQLIGNAVKFTNAGRIDVTAAVNGADLTITVKDTGHGLEPAMAEIILHSFRQIKSGLSHSNPAIGLGLALAQKIAVLFGGYISVTNRPGSGSEFTATLPLTGVTGGDPVVQKGIGNAGHKAAVLIIDGNDTSRTLKNVLRSDGLTVHSIGGMDAAIEVAETLQYDLVLVDLQSTGMDGSEAASRIRQMPGYERTPILALAAEAPEEAHEEYKSWGVEGFISKAVGSAQLIADVSRYMLLHRA